MIPEIRTKTVAKRFHIKVEEEMIVCQKDKCILSKPKDVLDEDCQFCKFGEIVKKPTENEEEFDNAKDATTWISDELLK
jgi:hypothetical protein